ncbi:MAG TPA: hypothetical protein VFE50_04220 [Cyclobacteriaceae bacterium]|nr:hypothetical protein [Cyclobacteriaceae bacterium]
MKFLLLILLQTLPSNVGPYAPELFPENLSGAAVGFSKDGKTIYFVREQPVSHKLWMYEAKRGNDRWVDERILPFSGFDNDMGGRLNAGGTALYFTSDRPGGSDDPKDTWNIWRVDLHGGEWGKPVPLKSVNNKGDECCPVPLLSGDVLFSGSRAKDQWQMLVANDADEHVSELSISTAWQWPSYVIEKKFLFFNSMKRADTKGMDDIYVSKWEGSKWGTPKNLGAPVNTNVYEDGAMLSPDGKLLIFCRHETGETPSRVLCVEWDRLAGN